MRGRKPAKNAFVWIPKVACAIFLLNLNSVYLCVLVLFSYQKNPTRTSPLWQSLLLFKHSIMITFKLLFILNHNNSQFIPHYVLSTVLGALSLRAHNYWWVKYFICFKEEETKFVMPKITRLRSSKAKIIVHFCL